MKATLRISTEDSPDIFVLTECEYEYSESDSAVITFSENNYYGKIDCVIGLHKDKLTLGLGVEDYTATEEDRRFDVYVIGDGYGDRKTVDFITWRATFIYKGAVCEYGATYARVRVMCLIEVCGGANKSSNILKIDLEVV